MHFDTTGQGRVRINPNLYADGKVYFDSNNDPPTYLNHPTQNTTSSSKTAKALITIPVSPGHIMLTNLVNLMCLLDSYVSIA